MKYLLLLLILSFFAPACGLREREMQLEQKMTAINQKEQELLLKEKSLQLKEEELSQREKLLDSTAMNIPDSFFAKHAAVPGKWNVTMRCIKATCAGFAIGDTKTEQWEISFQNSGIVVQAFSDNKLVRVYSGTPSGNIIELSTQPDDPDPAKATKMIVRINELHPKEMRGEREIIRPENCHVVYALELKKL